YHRFVVNRKQALPHRLRRGVQTSPRTACQNDSLIFSLVRGLFHKRFLTGRGCHLRRVVSLNPLPIAAAGHVTSPLVVLQIPTYGLANSTLKCFARTPPQFALNLTCIHGVAPIVPGTVFHEGDQ